MGNPRGSSGYGETHGIWVVGDAAEPAAADLLALLDAGLATGGLDSSRVGVLGGSYGGYMTTWLSAHHGDRFKAAISERAVNAIDSFEGSSDIGWFFAAALWGKDPAGWTAQNPLSFADQISLPMLIIHSENDWRCPVEQAQRLYVALKLRGVTTEMLLFPGEGHGLTRTGGRATEPPGSMRSWTGGQDTSSHGPVLAIAEVTMTVSRLRQIPGIGVNVIGDRADAAADPAMLRLENLDTDLRPPAIALEVTRRAIDSDAANSYLPFEGQRELRQAATAHVERLSGRRYDPDRECVSVAGGLNGVLNTLLAVTEPGSEVVLSDPIYAGLVNRIHLAGAVPRHVPARPTPTGWHTDPVELAAAVGPRTAAVLLMGPAMPTGAVFGQDHLDALAEPVRRHGPG